MNLFSVFRKKQILDLKQEPFVGISIFNTYTSCMGMGTSYLSPSQKLEGGPGFNARDFFEFTIKEISERRETESKIKGAWVNNEDILFYKDILGDMDKQIFINKMSKKYTVINFGDIHKLYDHGLTVNLGLAGGNNFNDKILENKIRNNMNEILKEK